MSILARAHVRSTLTRRLWRVCDHRGGAAARNRSRGCAAASGTSRRCTPRAGTVVLTRGDGPGGVAVAAAGHLPAVRWPGRHRHAARGAPRRDRAGAPRPRRPSWSAAARLVGSLGRTASRRSPFAVDRTHSRARTARCRSRGLAADVTDRVAMEKAVRAVRSRFGALHGIVHTAGVLDDGLIQLRTPEQSKRMLLPKLGGAQVLDAVTRISRQSCSLCSARRVASRASRGNATTRRRTPASMRLPTGAAAFGLEVLAVDWGIWQDAGMVAGTANAPAAPARPWLGARTDREGEFSSSVPGRQPPIGNSPNTASSVATVSCQVPGTELLTTAAVQAVADTPCVTLQRVEFVAAGFSARRGVAGGRGARAPRSRRLRSQRAQCARWRERGASAHHPRARAVGVATTQGVDLVDIAAWRREATAVAPANSDQGHVRGLVRGGSASKRCTPARQSRWGICNCHRRSSPTSPPTPCTPRCSTWRLAVASTVVGARRGCLVRARGRERGRRAWPPQRTDGHLCPGRQSR